nr:hypothetical protein [Listeria seeligeri]
MSITTYSTTNRIGAKSTQTYTTSDGTSQVIESVKENAVQRYGSSIGDPDTGTYVLPKNVVDKAISVSDGNPRVLEKLLGLEPGYLGDTPILLDINKMDGIRIPTGNESGAWQGFWEPGGFTNGGIPEAVVNQIPSGGYTVTDVFK